MAFQQIDDTAFTNRRPLDVALLKDIEGNYAAALQARTRGATCTFDLRDMPVWCALYRGVCPILWHLSPGTSEITVTVRLDPDAAASGSTLGAYIQHLDATSRAIPENEDEDIVSGTSGTTTLSLTLDTTGYSGWVLIGVTFESDQGTTVTLTDTGTAKGSDVFESSGAPFASSYVWINNTNSHYSAHEVPCAAIDLVDSSGSASPHYPTKQILRVESVAAGASYRLYVYPPFIRSGFEEVNDGRWSTTEDYAQITPLGSASIRSIEVRESAITALPSLGGMSDAGQSTAAALLQRLYARGELLFRELTRVHHIGPTQSASSADADFASGALSKAGHTMLHEDAWTTVRGFCVGGDSPYRVGTTGRVRTSYTVAFYFFLTHYENDAGPQSRPHSVQFRLGCTDLDGVTDSVVGDAVTFGTAAAAIPSWGHRGHTGAYRNPPPAHLGAFYTAGLSEAASLGTLRQHAFRSGLHPPTALATGNDAGWWYRATLTIRDTSPDDRRALFLQVRGGGASLDGLPASRYNGGRHIHVPTITVISTPYMSLDGTEPGVDV